MRPWTLAPHWSGICRATGACNRVIGAQERAISPAGEAFGRRTRRGVNGRIPSPESGSGKFSLGGVRESTRLESDCELRPLELVGEVKSGMLAYVVGQVWVP